MDVPEPDDSSAYTTPMQSDPQTSQLAPSSSSTPSFRPELTPQLQAPFTATSPSLFGPRDVQSQHQTPSERSSIISSNAPDYVNLGPSLPVAPLQTIRKQRDSWTEEDDSSLLERRQMVKAEKDADDPTVAPPSSSRAGIDRQESTTLTTLSRLFAVRAPTSPESSRTPSYIRPPQTGSRYVRALTGETADLPDHLFTRGLLEGRHSDITVNAFGHQYKLHRLVLDRAPFFRSALSEPWLESTAKETTLHPEEIDSTISQTSFELALKRLYGCGNPIEEKQDAVGLFATGCWLEMQDLIDYSVENMLRQMSPKTLAPLIKLVTNNYYGRAGEKILASAKAMLCRDGWKMPLKFWDRIPGDIVREIVGGDGFFIDSEWDRWVLARRILDRRLRRGAIDAGLVEHEARSPKKAFPLPHTANMNAVRFNRRYVSAESGVPGHLHPVVSLYTHADVEPILVLLDEGIHYIHLDFEQLQRIRNARDILGLPVMPDKVISNALWQQMELRQKVMNARDADMELDLSVKCPEDAVILGASKETSMSIPMPVSPPSSANSKRKVANESQPEAEDGGKSGSWDGNGKPRKFWIPTSDCNIVMGGNADPVVATSNNTTLQRHASRLSSPIQPEDVQWASDFAAVTSQPRLPSMTGENGTAESGLGGVQYTHFPPFRFAAEFPNPRLLKEKKRVYSRTVFYAGSLWNIYIQKVHSSKTKQLGVYLHRAKERETEEVVAGTAGLAQGSVDERIGALEREMILGSDSRERRRRRRTTTTGEGGNNDGAESSGSAGDLDTTFNETTSSAKPNSMRGLLSRARRHKSVPTGNAGSSYHSFSSTSPPRETTEYLTPDTDSQQSESEDEYLTAASKRFHVPTLPPYVDARPTIKTYFKIYSPSRGGRMLSVYESAPDRFNFSQSWGWKSASLMLDEGLLGRDIAFDQDEGGAENRGDVGAGRSDGKLRFMVVIGNI